jgi:hypothetical protein
MDLYKVAIGATFGRHSPHAVRAALFRLAGVFLAVLIVSWLLAKGLADTPLTAIPDSKHLIFTVAYILQAIVLFGLLAALPICRVNGSDPFARLLLVLPLGLWQRWAALLLPAFVVASVAAALTAWPLVTVMAKLGMQPFLIAVGGIVGTIAALGMVYGIPRKHAWIQVIGMPTLMWGEYWLLGTINKASSLAYLRTASGLGLTFLFVGLCWLFIRSSFHLGQDISLNTRGKNSVGVSLPTALWFAKKVLRSKTTLLGLAVAFGLSIATVVALKSHAPDPYLYAWPASILAAAFVSDIRPLSRRIRPAEITALRATSKFIKTYMLVAGACGLAAVSPLLGAILLAGSSIEVLLQYIVQIIFGISAGIFAGTLVVPAHRDVMGQILATLLCAGILVATPYIPIIKTLDASWLALAKALLAGTLIIVAWSVEYKRNQYIWRKVP